jgi:hypothetical protein
MSSKHVSISTTLNEWTGWEKKQLNKTKTKTASPSVFVKLVILNPQMAAFVSFFLRKSATEASRSSAYVSGLREQELLYKKESQPDTCVHNV